MIDSSGIGKSIAIAFIIKLHKICPHPSKEVDTYISVKGSNQRSKKYDAIRHPPDDGR